MIKSSEKNNVYLDYVHIFLRSLNFTHGIWMIYLVVDKGFTLWQVGIFEGIFHIASLSSEVPTGMIGDLYGRKLSRLLGIFTYLFYISIMIFANNFWMIAFGFVLCGVSYTFESGSGDALVYDSLLVQKKESTYIKYQSIKEIIFQLSGTIALVIGGYLALISYKLNFEVMFIVFVTASIPILLMKEIPLNHDLKSTTFGSKMYEHFIKSTKIVFSNKILALLLFTSALLAAPITTLFFYLQNYYESIDFSISTIGIILSLNNGLGILGAMLAVRLERKFKDKLILYIVPIFIVVLLWLVLIEAFSFVPFILLGFFDSIFYIVLNDYINKVVPSEQRATILSFSGMAFSIVMIILFPVIGIIAEFSTFMTAFTSLAIIVSVTYLFLLFSLYRIRKE